MRERRTLIWVKLHLIQIFVTFEKKINCIIAQLHCLGRWTHSGSTKLHHRIFVTVEHMGAMKKVTWACTSSFGGTWLLYVTWMLKLWKSAWCYLLNSAFKWVLTKWSSQRLGNTLGLEICFPSLEKCFACSLFQCFLCGIQILLLQPASE